MPDWPQPPALRPAVVQRQMKQMAAWHLDVKRGVFGRDPDRGACLPWQAVSSLSPSSMPSSAARAGANWPNAYQRFTGPSATRRPSPCPTASAASRTRPTVFTPYRGYLDCGPVGGTGAAGGAAAGRLCTRGALRVGDARLGCACGAAPRPALPGRLSGGRAPGRNRVRERQMPALHLNLWTESCGWGGASGSSPTGYHLAQSSPSRKRTLTMECSSVPGRYWT